MNRMRIVVWTAAALVVACVIAYAANGAGGKSERTAWEYAIVQTALEGNQLYISLSSADQFIDARDWPTFYQKIGAAPAPAERLPEAIMLNGMGSVGWELVSVYKPDMPPRATCYAFKRPAR